MKYIKPSYTKVLYNINNHLILKAYIVIKQSIDNVKFNNSYFYKGFDYFE